MSSFKRNLFNIALLTMPFLAFAEGKTVCYQANQPLYLPVPNVVCLETISEANQPGVLKIESANASLPSFISITQLSQHNEDRYTFVAEKTLIDENDGEVCGKSSKAVLRISGESLRGAISPDHLSISISQEYVKEACHFIGWQNTVNYSLR